MSMVSSTDKLRELNTFSTVGDVVGSYADAFCKYPISTTTGELLDRTVNVSSATAFTLPAANASGAARDLVLVIDLSSQSESSTITIDPAAGETVVPHPAESDTLTIEAGKINILLITEIMSGNFLYIRKAVS